MNSTLSRRSFLQGTALCSMASALGITSSRAAFGPIPHGTGTRLRPALNVYSFLELLNANAKDPTTGVDLFKVCDFAAAQGFDAVDLTGYFFRGYPDAPADEYLFSVKRHAHALGLDISGTGVRNDFVSADKAVRDSGIQCLKTWIEVAAKLGAPTIRAFAGPHGAAKDWAVAAGTSNRETVEIWMADALRECAEHGKRFGVMIAVQNHGDFLSTGTDHLSLLQRVNHEWCAALVDTGKYLTEDPYADIALMAPYAVNWQIKETMGSSVRSARVDMPKLIGLIRASGYRGYLPIETLAMGRKGYDSYVEVAKMLVEMREAITLTDKEPAGATKSTGARLPEF